MSLSPFLTIKDARVFLDENPRLYAALRKLLDHSISEKKTAFNKGTFGEEYDLLKPLQLIGNDQAEIFQLDYSELVFGCVLFDKAEALMGEKTPTNPEECLIFADRFTEELRKPKLNHIWYSNLQVQFESFMLVWLHQEHDFDVTGFIEAITEQDREDKLWVRSLDLTYTHAFAYLSDPPQRRYLTIVRMLKDQRTIDSGYEALRDLGKINSEAATQLYQYSKTQRAFEHDGYLPNLIIGLYNVDKSHYMNEAIALFSNSPVQSLLALIWIDYTDSDQVRKAYDFLIHQSVDETPYLRNAFIFYIRLIGNANTPTDLIPLCFRQLKEYSKSSDEHLRRDLLWRTRLIKGFDKEKYDLIPEFSAWGDPTILEDYFNNFDSPKYLFSLIRDAFLQNGMRASIAMLKDSLQYQHSLHKVEFEMELVNMLSDDMAIIRFGGMQVLMSPSYGVYTLNLVDMEEKTQIRIIETLLPTPINIEEILPIVLQLRNSAFETVRLALEKGLIDLIQAFDHNLVDIVKGIVDSDKAYDKQLLEALEKAYAAYKEQQDKKRVINEFDPRINEFRHIDLYYRLEIEQQAEAMETAQEKSIFAHIAKKTTVIRGSGYEGYQGEVAQLQEFSISRLVDKRLYINPDKFELYFRQNATGNNYLNNPKL